MRSQWIMTATQSNVLSTFKEGRDTQTRQTNTKERPLYEDIDAQKEDTHGMIETELSMMQLYIKHQRLSVRARSQGRRKFDPVDIFILDFQLVHSQGNIFFFFQVLLYAVFCYHSSRQTTQEAEQKESTIESQETPGFFIFKFLAWMMN